MVQRLMRLMSLALPVVVLAGCSGGDDTPVVQDSPEVKAAVQQAASEKWTPENQAALKNALSRARSGEEGNGASPTTSAPEQNWGGTPQQGNTGSTPSYTDQGASAPVAGGSAPASNATGSRMPGPSGRPNDVGSNGSDPMVGK